MSTSIIHRILILGFAVLRVLGHPDAGSATDPFYDRLLQDGIEAHDRGDQQAAVKNLRLACFGLLDEPTVLARGLTYLALAQATIDDQAGFSGTFDRILEVERRFGAFSQLDLGADLRESLEAHLERWIPYELLDRAPAFREAARRKLEARIFDLPAEKRRPELQRLAAAEPERAAWGIQLAELELGSGNYQAALAAADQLLAHDPALDQARCLRGQAGVATGACEQALVDLESCQELEYRPSLAEDKLECLVRLRDWQSASTLLGEIPADRRRKSPFRQLAREIRKGQKAASEAAAASAAAAEAAATADLETGSAEEADPGQIDDSLPDSASEPVASEGMPSLPVAESAMLEETSPEDAATLPSDLSAELERTRQLLPSSSRGELEAAFVTARELADRYPQLTEPQHLAAEIAYRLSRWQEAVSLFERGGRPEPSQPNRLFYLAVALFETGDRAAAQGLLERCLPSLETTPFVRSYVDRILPVGHELSLAPRSQLR